MNSKRPSRLGVFAIENERVSSVPGTWKSMYWPGKSLMSSPSSTKDLQAAHWPSLQPCMSWTPCSAAARRMVWSSSTSISMPTGSNPATCFSPHRVSRLWERAGFGRGKAGRARPPPSPDPRSGVGRGGAPGRSLTDVVGRERLALGVAHLVEQHVRALQVGHPAHVVERPHLLGVEIEMRLRG